MSLIQLKDVYKIYAEGQENQVNALDGVTLSIDQGEFVAIIGTSGSGKSTMMNILGCLDVPPGGSISWTAPRSGSAPRGSCPRSAPGRLRSFFRAITSSRP